MFQVQAYITCECTVQVHGNITPENIDQLDKIYVFANLVMTLAKFHFDLLKIKDLSKIEKVVRHTSSISC